MPKKPAEAAESGNETEMNPSPAAAPPPPLAFVPGAKVRLSDGRTGILDREAKGAYPPGWYVKGVLGPVSTSALELVLE